MLKGYRTLIFNIVSMAAMALGYTALPEETLYEYTDAIILVGGLLIAGGNIVLRLVTSGPIFGKEPKAPTKKKAASKARSLIAVLFLVVAGGGLVACATPVAETSKQRMYAIERDFNSAQVLILSFFETSYATPEIKAHVKKLEKAAKDAVVAASDAVQEGDSPITAALIATARNAVSEILIYLRSTGWLTGPPQRTAWSGIAAVEPVVIRIPLTVQED